MLGLKLNHVSKRGHSKSFLKIYLLQQFIHRYVKRITLEAPINTSTFGSLLISGSRWWDLYSHLAHLASLLNLGQSETTPLRNDNIVKNLYLFNVRGSRLQNREKCLSISTSWFIAWVLLHLI